MYIYVKNDKLALACVELLLDHSVEL